MKRLPDNLLFSNNDTRATDRGEKGFSLLELILGLGLFAVIALSAYSTFWAGMKLSRRAQGEGAVYREMRWGLELMARELENMVPYNFSNSYPELSAFKGEDDRITFILAAKDGLKAVSYYLLSPQEASVHKVIIGQTYGRNVDILIENRQAQKISCLMREERDLLDYLNGSPADDAGLEIIAANIEKGSLNFSFGYLEDKESGLPVWENQWQQKDIPRAVRIEINFLSAGADKRKAPVIRDVFIPRGSWGGKES